MSRQSPAQRLLDAAGTLFASEGIRAVGVDRLLGRAQVARASLYQHYGSKDGLVLAYLSDRDARDRTTVEAARARAATPLDRALAPFDCALSSQGDAGYPGCLYLNASGDVRDDSRCTQVIQEHRAWLADLWRSDIAELGLDARLVDELVLLYDGALAGARAASSAHPIEVARRVASERLSIR